MPEESTPPAIEPTHGRDDFGRPTRQLVAAEVAYRCSNPDCMAPTVGPAATPGKVIDIGVAAHITAASARGPRFDASLTPEQRKSASNAIWLCQSCAKQIDSDTSTHTVPMLQRWKSDAVALAARALALRDPDPDGRLKLAREERHNLCARAVRAAVHGRGLILEGVDLARHLRDALVRGNDAITNFGALMEQWKRRVEAAKEALYSSILDVRVYWPEHSAHGVVELYVRLETWRNWFTENVLISIGHKATHSRPHQELWSWDQVFAGNEEHTNWMKEQLNKDVANVEKWASPHIAGRERLLDGRDPQ